MKKLSSKLLALLLSISMLGAVGLNAIPASAAQGTSAGLTVIKEFLDGGAPAVTNGTAETLDNLPDKASGDKGIKFCISEGKTNAYAELSVFDAAETSSVSARTIIFEVYPNDTVTSIKLCGRGTLPNYQINLSDEIPMEAFEPGQWNRVMLLYNPDGYHSLYINDALYQQNNNTHFGTSLKYANFRLYAYTGETEGAYIYFDEIQTAKGTAVAPPATSEKYIIENNFVQEYGLDTVGDVLSNITYNGSNAVIKDINGTDITSSADTVITEGDHLYIYDGDCITGHYYFKSAHISPVIINSHIDDFDGISVTGGAYTTETGMYGKGASDTSMKLTADTSNVTADTGTVYFAENLLDAETKSIPASIVSFEVYPNNTISEIVIAGRANLPNYEITFQKIPVSDLAEEQWNKILFVYNTTGENKVYLNGNLYSSISSGHFGETLNYGNIRVKANYTKQDGVTPYVYIDEYQDAYGKTLMPPMTTSAYGIEGNKISGCTDTAANVKANINTAFGAKLVIKNADGVEIADNETVAPGSSIYVYDGDMIIGHYYTEAGKMIVNTPVITNSGTNAGDTVTAELTYTETDGTAREFSIYLAAYNAEGGLIGVNVRKISTSGNDGKKTVTTQALTLSESAHEIKAIVMDENLVPLCDYGHV